MEIMLLIRARVCVIHFRIVLPDSIIVVKQVDSDAGFVDTRCRVHRRS